MVRDNKEVAEIFNHYYSLVQNVSDVPTTTVEDFRDHPSIRAIMANCPVTDQFHFSHVNSAELETILKSLNVNKATGHDSVPARALRDCASALAQPLATLINSIIDSACVPTEWKLAEISPIFKKDDEFDKSKYRPVSILVLLDKVFERCLNRQLVQHFSGILSKFLSAYRKGYSCECVLLRLVEDWRRALDKKCVEAELSNYADDNQIYYSDVDPAKVEYVLNKELAVACKWFRDNKMTLNPEKCKALVLSSNNRAHISLYADGEIIPRVYEVELLGVVIDDALNFSTHVSKIIKKAGKQLDVICRLRNVLSSSSKLCLYNSFVMSYFTYCSSIWHNCLKSDSDKLEKLHERALRYIYKGRSSSSASLCSRIGYTLSERRIQDTLIIIFKCLNNLAPVYLKDLFCVRDNIKNLRGINKIVLPKVNTTKYGLKSVRYWAANAWNQLPDRVRTIATLQAFRNAVRS
ncbi:hypothetical protein ACROYT_G022385 [Oculina patagonica]